MKIGVFDSGLGGLSIFKNIQKQLPTYDYIYLGDNARVPYGNRSPQLIYEFTKRAVEYLFSQDCKLVILACNTASANALKRLQEEYLPSKYSDRRILGIIYPVVEETVQYKLSRVGILATRATVLSESYVKEFARLAPTLEVFQEAAPLLVPIIEEGEIEWEGLNLLLIKYLKPLLAKKITGLLLGCTHYGLIADKIQTHLPPTVTIVSQGEATAKRLQGYLQKHQEITQVLSTKAEYTYYVTDLNPRFEEIAQRFMGSKIKLQAVAL